MEKTFLYRLLDHSKTAFIFLVIFIMFYAVVFYKKMDMVLFPYNDMFSTKAVKTNQAFAYAIKVNGRRIEITRHLYWKKDFLEESLTNYYKYKMRGDALFLDDYLHAKVKGEKTRNFLLDRLTPAKASASLFPGWYAVFAGMPVPKGSSIELIKYDFIFERNQAALRDSFSICKTIVL